jgi:hypothetical protein
MATTATRAFIRSNEIGTGLWIFDLTGFLAADRGPTRITCRAGFRSQTL